MVPDQTVCGAGDVSRARRAGDIVLLEEFGDGVLVILGIPGQNEHFRRGGSGAAFHLLHLPLESAKQKKGISDIEPI